MSDRQYSAQEIQDRFAIEDLYDRQLAAAEAFDFDSYDTTFTADAELDLSDFSLEPCAYPEYRQWLMDMSKIMVNAQRIRGGLRLKLDGDTASCHVPVACHVRMDTGSDTLLTHTGIFYRDELRRLDEGWRISKRKEELNWSA